MGIAERVQKKLTLVARSSSAPNPSEQKLKPAKKLGMAATVAMVRVAKGEVAEPALVVETGLVVRVMVKVAMGEGHKKLW